MLQHAVRSRLIQLRPPNGELQGEAITEATIQGLNEYVRDPQNELGRIEDLFMVCEWWPRMLRKNACWSMKRKRMR